MHAIHLISTAVEKNSGRRWWWAHGPELGCSMRWLEGKHLGPVAVVGQREREREMYHFVMHW